MTANKHKVLKGDRFLFERLDFMLAHPDERYRRLGQADG